ncbi:MAG TPA: betaine--homocysteine S-methyltransferase [Phototrophicaceae bacterium]|nr:betaine--homocysteine S-methyltransferase [Phototrophicaceae bacterium]
MKTTLQNLLATGKTLVADGGMGSLLFARGLVRGAAPELWNVERPDDIRAVHRDYIQAGAQIVLTNSFGGNRLRLDLHDLGSRVAELNQAAARLARMEADAVPQPVVVGGSMGPTGQLLAPLGTLDFDEAVNLFCEQAMALVAGGVDVLWVETMSDLEEIRAAVEGIRCAAPGFPIVTTLTFDANGRTMMGTTPEKALSALYEFGVVALGGNCGNGPAEIEGVITKMHAANPAVALVAKANAGLPHMDGERAIYDATPEVMADYARRVQAQGARIIGACCGSTPDHIRAIAGAVAEGHPV